ncbi:MAG: DUF362 domain-containing protein [candidate division KSB1 bacterium]|nr:DUF362 domain-containing protein [candidate division KSB1 bacterium]
MRRRDFLRAIAGSALAAALLPEESAARFLRPADVPADLAVARNGEPAQLVQAAVEALGGMSRFVSRGDIVVVKPNIGWDRLPEQAANTNPEVVAEVVRLCYQAGAKKVLVFDHTSNRAQRCYLRSGIQAAAKEAGAEVSFVHEQKFRNVEIREGVELKSWPFYKDVLEADVLINVPIAKHHSMARLTVGLKNIMGVIGGDRGAIHNHFARKIVDLNTVVKPKLTLVDGYRILRANGPQGGSPRDVQLLKTVVASTDRVAADAYAATWFGLGPQDLDYLVEAHRRGLGEIDFRKLKIREIDLGS